MAQRQGPLDDVFASIDRVTAALEERHGPAGVDRRVRLAQDLASRLPLKYLPAATTGQIEATEKMLSSEGVSRQDLKTLRLTLVDLFDQFVLDKVLRWHPLRGEDGGIPNPVSMPEVGLAVDVPVEFGELIGDLVGPMGYSVHREGSNRAALQRAGWYPFSFVICAFPMRAPARFLEALRGAATVCRSAGIILVTDDEHRDGAERFLGRGANRVIAATEVPGGFANVMTELGQVSERVRLRVPVEVGFNRDRRKEGWRSENISATGMLLRTESPHKVGEMLELQFRIPRSPRPIRVIAEIVRGTTFGREDFSGFGVRFLSFSGGGQFHLERFLQ